MGILNTDPSNQTSIRHFSHPHPLHLSNLQSPATNSITCSACKLQPTSPAYICTKCKFLLHPKCSQLPKQIKHEFHKSHTLFLQSKTVYPQGLFICDGCGNPGNGFSYHCSPCGLDLHSTCASLPVQFSHKSHQHQLRLTFSVPYLSKSFLCNVCMRPGSNFWFYRCGTCEFDAHLTCVKTIIPNVSNSQSQVMGHTIRARSVQEFPTNFNNPSSIGALGFPPLPAYGADQANINNGLREQVMVGAVDEVASGASQSAAQVLFGSGGRGGARGSGGGGGGVGTY